jgi:ABC-type Fe3+-hydroxamate transport system substrate-binding protein
MITAIGNIVGRTEEALQISRQIKTSFSSALPVKTRTCIYLIWKNPYMAAGTDTFINQMLIQAGFVNLLPPDSRYPELDIQELVRLNPEVLLLSSEPYPFAEKHILELQELLPFTRIILVNGEFFSWYGSRLVNSQSYFNALQASLNA